MLNLEAKYRRPYPVHAGAAGGGAASASRWPTPSRRRHPSVDRVTRAAVSLLARDHRHPADQGHLPVTFMEAPVSCDALYAEAKKLQDGGASRRLYLGPNRAVAVAAAPASGVRVQRRATPMGDRAGRRPANPASASPARVRRRRPRSGSRDRAWTTCAFTGSCATASHSAPSSSPGWSAEEPADDRKALSDQQASRWRSCGANRECATSSRPARPRIRPHGKCREPMRDRGPASRTIAQGLTRPARDAAQRRDRRLPEIHDLGPRLGVTTATARGPPE